MIVKRAVKPHIDMFAKKTIRSAACGLFGVLFCLSFVIMQPVVNAFADDETNVNVKNDDDMDSTIRSLEQTLETQPAAPVESSAQIFGRYFSQPAAYEMTGRQLESARSDKARAERELDKTQETLENLEDERYDIQTYLIQVNDKLQEANLKLTEYQDKVNQKARQIDEARDNILDAKHKQVQRKEDMKGRIKYMYEQGSESYLDILLSAKSFSDFLNKAQYFESINQYDRKMLVEYTKTEAEIERQEINLAEEKKALEALSKETEKKAAEIYQEVIEASASMKDYTEQIEEKEAQALAYEQEIAEKEGDIASLMEQYKAELALSSEAAAMGSRDLSDVVFANGDLDLMAAMIECEAGGESYTGKVAVGAVILNRVRSPRFPSTVLEVLMQNRQFSPVASGRFAMVLARGANASCYQAAQDAMAGASPVGGCLFFRTPIPGLVGQQIGGHIFY